LQSACSAQSLVVWLGAPHAPWSCEMWNDFHHRRDAW
jgi:hypothetical protein